MAYQTGDTLAVARMTSTTGLLEDEVVNTFAFRRTTTPVEANFLAMADAIDDFYNVDGAGGNNVGDYISEAVNRAATHTIDFYKIQVGPLGSPIWSVDWLGPGAPNTSALNLPNEVAGCLSYHADLSGLLEESGTTRPKARRRGRIYIGPLTGDAIVLSSSVPRLSTAFTAAMREAAVALMDTGDTTGNIWGVWSREAVEVFPIVGGWTDNAPDTQRRRGLASTARVVWG